MTTAGQAPPPELHYASADSVRLNVHLLRAAVACWSAPLFLGVVIFVSWLVTGFHWLEGAGLVVLLCGVVLSVAAIPCLLLFHQNVRQLPPGARRLWGRRTRLVVLLLLSNFPVAAGVVVSAVAIETRYTVVVLNRGTSPIDSFVLSGAGFDQELGPIAPGSAGRHSFYVSGDGQLTFRASQGGKQIAGTVDSYLTDGMGGRKEVIVQGGSATVRNVR